MTDQTTRRFARPLVAVAALLGLLAGAAAVYVRETRSGNGAGGETAAADCAAAQATVGRITPLLKGQVAAMAPQMPRPLPPLSFTNAEGKPQDLSAFAGKTLLVNLWATWCVPCREEMPALDALQRDMGDDRFQVLAVNIDMGGDEKPKAFLDEIGVKALALNRDASMGVFNTLKKEGLAFGLPATFLVDPKGCLLSAMNGPAAWDSPDAKALIAAVKGI
ncbi:sodium:dicarboxylate symporter [Xaviernesmea oryzae]|uniref:Sodium:dicarboxylate symporter n=1 Tax=Xaviernesmea oryzae TaxID=464029 RepID=A0A1Q9B2D3_9HYPH|nr:TlpA disulfide reductase family protein [Xaviernesmea oryzae]OLP62132.1 sodium:dicarboxylate symporter [Xaviernesmea oryzae]SEL88595.1 Thiol-disulfide isomerase or thioredoxin [Xaviernesmea oryzae]